MKMCAVQIQQGLLKALKGNQGLFETMSVDEKEDMLERAHSALLLCLADNVLRKVSQETTAAGLWNDSISMEEVEVVINSQELRKKVIENKGEEQCDGLMARGRSIDYAGSRNKRRSSSQSKVKKLKCCHWHKEWHYRKDCPEHKEKKKDNFKTADARVVEDNSDGRDVLPVTINSSDIGHVRKLRKILISLGMLDSNGCSYWAAGGVMRIMKGALVVMKWLKQNSLYLLQGSTVTGAAAAATVSSSDIDSDTTKLWHMRLGHMSERGMDVLSKQGLLGSKKIGKLDFLEHSVFAK
ncbi:hypothetical protein RJ640_001603 [Escallonia rubra]|uniref:GAG-pre-integrase domain-containing protein n=1 Tax=Escallonia rubra TaxID=112253 RepID=A0AA88U639_9ASTE|nr:hypothetical protein RJ640_001603 [Escallonia rubra]